MTARRGGIAFLFVLLIALLAWGSVAVACPPPTETPVPTVIRLTSTPLLPPLKATPTLVQPTIPVKPTSPPADLPTVLPRRDKDKEATAVPTEIPPPLTLPITGGDAPSDPAPVIAFIIGLGLGIICGVVVIMFSVGVTAGSRDIEK